MVSRGSPTRIRPFIPIPVPKSDLETGVICSEFEAVQAAYAGDVLQDVYEAQRANRDPQSMHAHSQYTPTF